MLTLKRIGLPSPVKGVAANSDRTRSSKPLLPTCAPPGKARAKAGQTDARRRVFLAHALMQRLRDMAHQRLGALLAVGQEHITEVVDLDPRHGQRLREPARQGDVLQHPIQEASLVREPGQGVEGDLLLQPARDPAVVGVGARARQQVDAAEGLGDEIGGPLVQRLLARAVVMVVGAGDHDHRKIERAFVLGTTNKSEESVSIHLRHGQVGEDDLDAVVCLDLGPGVFSIHSGDDVEFFPQHLAGGLAHQHRIID
ncbi:MAG: hypothetical protein LKM39_04655 [Chiayiivirga sp.]|nr:hypothetical protein [Chiayiivirga sp.]